MRIRIHSPAAESVHCTAWSLACLAGPDSDAAGGAPLRDHQAQPHQPQPGYRTEFVLSELGKAQRQTVHALITERVN